MSSKLSFLKIQPDFIPTKVIMFSYYGGKYMVISFFVVFLKSFGINPEQAGIITGCRSAAQTIGGMFLGWLVDYTKRRRLIFIGAILVLVFSLILMPLLGFMITDSNGLSYEENIFDLKQNITDNNNGTENSASTYLSSSSIFDLKNSILFWCFLVFSIVFGFSDGIHGLIDGSIMNHVKNNGKGRTNYSYQRLWGSLGYGTIPIMAGILLDIFKNSYFSYYMPVFYLFSFLTFIMLVCLIQTIKSERTQITELFTDDANQTVAPKNVQKIRKSEPVIKMLLKTLYSLDLIVVIWNSFLNGVAGTCQWGFIYLLMEDEMTNVTKTVMGVSFIASSFIEAFVAPFIKGAAKKLGNSFTAMSVSLVGYGLTFFLYYITENGVMVFFINMIAGITYPFYLYTAQEEIYKLSKKECVSFMFTFDRGVYSGLGGGIGGVVAGSLYKSYGGRVMYLAIGVFYGISAVKTFLYGIYKLKNTQKEMENNNLLECVELKDTEHNSCVS